MKDIGAKLKGLDYKQLLLEHGEKIVFGLVALISVFALMSTSWSSFSDFTPEQLVSSVSSASNQLESREWPDEQKSGFSATDSVGEQSKFLRNKIDVRPYEYDVAMTWQLYPPVKKIQEPKWLRVEDAIADYGQVIVPILPGLDSDDDTELASVDKKDEKDPRSSQFAPRTRGGATTAGGPPAPGGGDEISNILSGGGSGAGPVPPGLAPPGKGGPAPPGVAPSGFGSGGGEGLSPTAGLYTPEGAGGGEGMGFAMGGGNMTQQLSRGERYVAVRGVFPMDMQARRIFEASNASYDRNAVRAIVRIFDFEVERKERLLRDPEDTWSDWGQVDLDVAKEFMQKLANFDSPVVHQGVRDRVITAPLPGRLLGYWGDHAWHPSVANYRLTPEQQRLADFRDEKLAEILSKNEELQRQQTEQQLGGFAVLQADGNQLQAGAMGLEGGANMMAQMSNPTFLSGELNMSATQAQQTISELQGKNADGYVLLFRYFDFDVEPGKAYQYRVRLKIKNPNQLRKLEDVVDQSVLAGDFRYTEWSEVTKPTIVPEEVHYFLSDVNTPRNAGFPMEANFDIYQWYQETGTTIYNNLKLSLGGFIGGNPEETKVLRPATPSLESEEGIEFETSDFVVDLSDSIYLDYRDKELHADLELPRSMQGRIGDAEEGLVLNSLGDLLAVDPISLAALKSQKEQRLDEERAGFRDIEDMQKKTAEAAGTSSALDERINELAGEGGGGEGAAPKRSTSRRRRNALRLGGGGMPGMGGSGTGAGGYSPPGGYAPPGGYSPPGGRRSNGCGTEGPEEF